MPKTYEVEPRTLRAVLAAEQIRHQDFARACGLSRTFVSRVLRGGACGELARRKIYDGLHALHLDGEVQHGVAC
jgi:hypothetical protein